MLNNGSTAVFSITQVQRAEFFGQGGNEIVLTVFEGLIDHVAALFVESRTLDARAG